MHLTLPLPDEAHSLLPILRRLAALTVPLAILPDESSWQLGCRLPAAAEPGWRLSWQRGVVDPYAGGNTFEQKAELVGLPGKALRLQLAEVAWCGLELQAWCEGPDSWCQEIRALLEPLAKSE